jgi:hypothetical protein
MHNFNMQDENNINDHKSSKLGSKLVLVLWFVVIVLVLGFIFRSTIPSGSTKPAIKDVQDVAKIKFSDTPDNKYSYQIFPGEITSEAKAALSGFNVVSQVQEDGSAIVTLTANDPEYKDQQYTVKPGEILYFIERSMGDDDVANSIDRYLGDDTAIVVDTKGFVVQ